MEKVYEIVADAIKGSVGVKKEEVKTAIEVLENVKEAIKNISGTKNLPKEILAILTPEQKKKLGLDKLNAVTATQRKRALQHVNFTIQLLKNL